MAEQVNPEVRERNIYENYSTSTRGTIVGMYNAGMNKKAIAAELGCNVKTVRLWIRRYLEGDDAALADHRKQNKRPKITSPEEDLQFCNFIQENPFSTIKTAIEETEIPISVSTGNRRIKEIGITAHRPQIKTKLTEAHRAERIQFAMDHLNWTPQDWAKVIWSDEKVFTSAADGRHHVYRPRGREFMLQPQYVLEKQWSGRITCGFWGCISAAGVMAFQEIPPRMNAVNYINILENVMLPYARARFPQDEYEVIHFMQDNSAVHTARIVQEWFQQHPEINLLKWPSKSPDLNPIENVWSIMVRSWQSGQDRTREALVQHAENTWEEMRARPEVIQKLCDSMPNRMQKIIESNGYWINY